MGSSCEGDALILCRLLGFAVKSFDRPPQLGTVGPVVYALNEFSPLSSFVIRCRLGDLIIHCRQPGRGGQLLVFLAISWKMARAQFAFYLLPVSGPIILLEVDVGSVPGRR